jgi:GGDEF domain-containing protein
MGAAYILQANFRGSDYIVRYATNQFLVVLPDTDQQQAQIALSRLIDRVEHWNRTNEQWEMALRLELGVCPPGGNFWAKLSEIEVRVGDNSDPSRALILRRRAAHEAPAPDDVPPQGQAEEHPQEHRVQ